MVMAFTASVMMGLCAQGELDRVVAHYKAIKLPASPKDIQPNWDADKLMEHFTRDKKTTDGKLTFILTRGIGKAFIATDVEKTLVRQVLVQTCDGM